MLKTCDIIMRLFNTRGLMLETDTLDSHFIYCKRQETLIYPSPLVRPNLVDKIHESSFDCHHIIFPDID